ncbi:large subunit rRNA methyltransferase, putative [Plasmodium gallinaceum]|uniref:Putative rRNA methyltransferase n=1 Tax=Plasmodium gallinaceum TaxID=5849 RepID=A0A1J1GS75_PLAGA|nr:large subunit rRNA methyltransferase, putative [Plasmodium gallinaceum]CRG93899.1 large subunit rRNA methyltransferase, putative [Plasmodium gallinaceum]
MGKKKKVGKERIDKYYKLAKTAGYRARSAFKLIQIAQKYNIFKDAKILIDLCAAPGGWLQVAYKNMNKSSTIIGIDLVPIRKIDDNVITIKSDITTGDCIKKIKNIIQNEKADVILNDGAPNVGTTYSYDSYNQNILVLNSIKIAHLFLKKNGIFITKVFRNEEYISLIWVLEKLFAEVKHIKPRSSREISSEIYLIAINFLNNKVDKKLFDYTYVFSDEFKKDYNKINSLHKNETDFSDNSDEEETNKKIKKKKGLSTILKQKKKKNRQGYDVGDDYRDTDICNFINSDNYIDLLIKNNKFTFDKNYENSSDPLIKTTYNCIYKNEETTEEILHLCNDLKILGKSDLFHLIKWRYKIKNAINRNINKKSNEVEKEKKENEQKQEEEKEKDSVKLNVRNISEDELSNSSDDYSERDEINEFSSYIEKKEQKKKKKKEKKLKKELEKKKKSNQTLKIDYDEEEIHFNKDMLKLLNKQKFEDHLKILNNNDDEKLEIYEDKSEISEENYSSDKSEENRYLKKLGNSKLDELEYLVNLDYEKQKMKEKKLQEEKKIDNMTRRKRAMDYKNEELMKIQKIMELKNEELLMKKKLHDYLSDEESSDDNSLSEKDKSDDNNYEIYKKGKYEKDSYETSELLKENLHIKNIVNKIMRLRKDVKKKEEEHSNMSRFFDQKIFTNIFDQLDNETNNDNNVDEKKGALKKENTIDKKYDSDSINDDNLSEDISENIKEMNESQLPKIPLPEKLAKKEKKKKLKEKYGNNEVKMKNSSFSIVKTNENSQNINNYFSNLVKDEDELAFIRCIGEKLIHKKSRMDLIDESFNRNSYLEDEDTLPEWFLEEEKKFRKPVISIDKKILDQYKSKINKITRMPIKKVIEAKMRNKKREIAKMKKLETKIGKIEKNEDDPFLQQKAITNLLRKNKSEKKREKSYIVCTGKGSKIANKKKKKGGKSIVKYVDKRLKKDKRAKKRIEKKRKNISKHKYSKSKPFKFRRKN